MHKNQIEIIYEEKITKTIKFYLAYSLGIISMTFFLVIPARMVPFVAGVAIVLPFGNPERLLVTTLAVAKMCSSVHISRIKRQIPLQ